MKLKMLISVFFWDFFFFPKPVQTDLVISFSLTQSEHVIVIQRFGKIFYEAQQTLLNSQRFRRVMPKTKLCLKYNSDNYCQKNARQALTFI